MTERGLVITPNFTYDGEVLHILGGFAPESLRLYLLYWDKLDWPDNNIISFGEGEADMQALKAIGVLERTPVQFNTFSGNVGDAMLRMQVAALEARNNKDPGNWSLAQRSSILVSPENAIPQTRSLEVELYSSIPVPLPEVSFDDVISFKQRRRDELLHFRAVMDTLYQEVIQSGDVPRARNQAIDRIERAVQDLHAAFAESFGRRLLSSLKVELNLPSIAAFAAGGAAAAQSYGLSLALGAAIGAVGAAVKFNLSYIRKGHVPETLKDYAYLHSLEKELI
ncbi:MAG: DUF6236 family protein [Nitrospiraceae bacterium]